MIFVAGGVFCQNTLTITLPEPEMFAPSALFQIKNNWLNGSFFHKRKRLPMDVIKPAIHLSPVFVIRSDHYTQNFGFFCKKELQLEKLTKIPVKFRLGSIQYCDRMEGKQTAGILGYY